MLFFVSNNLYKKLIKIFIIIIFFFETQKSLLILQETVTKHCECGTFNVRVKLQTSKSSIIIVESHFNSITFFKLFLLYNFVC